MWTTEPSESWHAIFVTTGDEETIKKVLDKTFDHQIQFIVPKRELRERKSGKWHIIKRNLFPGYILAKGTITIESYYKLKKIPMMTKLLKNDDGPLEIEGKELEVLKILICPQDGNIGISTAYKENEKVRVSEGPLAGLEGIIQSIDLRKGRAKVKLNFLGETRTVQLGIDIVDKIEEK